MKCPRGGQCLLIGTPFPHKAPDRTMVPFFWVPYMVTEGLSIQSLLVQADIICPEGDQYVIVIPTILGEAGCGWF